MYIIELSSRKHFNVEILQVDSDDLKSITASKYFFNWKLEKEFEIFKLNTIDNPEILGLVSIERIPEEWRIHIRLLTVSTDNKGKHKKYDRIVGNLLTFVAKYAIKEYAELACVSLKPKGAIAKHYIDTYGMNVTGASLSIELTEILSLIEKYDNDK